MIEILLTPLAYTFMQRGIVAALLVGILCSVIGAYVVLRSMAFLGDALAHAVLPGVAIAYLMQGNITVGALIAAVLVAFGIGFFSKGGLIKEDTAIGILFAAALSLGIVLISSIRSYAVDLSHILFGNVLGVSSVDLWWIACITVFVLGTVFLYYREFLLVSFDPILATTLRIHVDRIRFLLLLLLALTIVISMQSVGIGLVASMLVTPSATASLLTKRLPAMMVLSAIIGAFSSIGGLYISYYANVASGAAIVLTATLIFFLVFLFSPEKGLVWRHHRSHQIVGTTEKFKESL